MYRIKLLTFLLSILISSLAYAGHNPLLPRPQEINYGTGSISLDGMKIMFASPPNDEDLFAAEELSRLIAQRTGIRLSIPNGREHRGQGRVILFDRTGDLSPLARPGDLPGPQSREAYDLSVTARGVKIHARSSAGIFYGVETLSQLVEGTGAASIVPEVDIHDWPSLAFRGTMIDISHGPLPTEAEIERQLDFLARWKDNQYYLYNEASIELSGYPLLNPTGRLTKDAVRRIVAYGRQRHIDVIPNLELYGHLHDLFRIEQYSDLADLPHGTEFDPQNPKVKALLTDWIEQFADLFPSPFVHIGFDETFQIEIAAQVHGITSTPSTLFIRQLTDVVHLFQHYGKHVMAYDDIMVKYPQIVPSLPPGLIAVAWYYDPVDPEYTRWLGPLVANHVPHIVQPGITSWQQIAPDYERTFQNIDTFLAAGRQSHALGLINSVWTDDAQILLRMSFPGIAYGAAAPWQSVPMDRAHFFSDYAHVMYPPSIAGDIASALEEMSQAETDLQKVVGGQTMQALWEDPFSPNRYAALPAHRQDLRQTRLHAERAETSLASATSLGVDPITTNSLIIGSRLLDYAGQKFQTPIELSDLWRNLGPRRPDFSHWAYGWNAPVASSDHARLADLMDAITGLRSAYRDEWLKEYTPYRLGTALGRWDAEYFYWRNVQQKLQQFSATSHEGDMLPPLDQLIEGDLQRDK